MQKFLPTFVFALVLLSTNLIQANTSPLEFGGDDTPSTLTFNLNECFSSSDSPGSANDYSEFTAVTENSSDCADIAVVGDHLYRLNPDVNAHSCSPGVDNSIAMCVGISTSCDFIPGDEKSVRFDVSVNPTGGAPAILTELSFFENSPEEFSWINGPSGLNNYPTKYAIRVLVDGNVIYEADEIDTENSWNQEIYNFSDLEAFTVTETTIFNFELTPYCPIGNNASVAAWDLDNIIVSAGCIPVDGGVIALENGETEIEICVGDGISDPLDVILTDEIGESYAWVITDSDLNILALPAGPPFDLEGAGAGTCLIWHLAYIGDITGAEEGENAANLEGCFDLSNPITVIRKAVNGGELSTSDGETMINICAGDGVSDVFDVSLTGNEGQNMAWVITDSDGNILALPDSAPFDLEEAGNGTCLIWNLAFYDGLEGATVGSNAAELIGCFDLSNPITVVREGVNGGELSTEDGLTELTICAGDGISDVFDVNLTETEGANMAWVITDSDGKILGLPDAAPFDLEGAGEGTCLIWNISFADELVGLDVDLNTNDLEGCYDLSNPITVTRNGVNGGELATTDGLTELSICVGDGISDAFDVTLTDAEGESMAWVITDAEGNILGLPDAPPFDLEGAGSGTCLIWNLSYTGVIEGAEEGSNAANLAGCFDLSNPITVNRGEAVGGNLSFANGETEIDICVGDGNADPLDVELTDNIGANMAWVITNPEGEILDLPSAPPFDLEGAGGGTCLIWNLAFVDGLEGAEIGMNANELIGCHSLSNPISVNRIEVDGGMLTTADGETNILICADDGESDAFDVSLNGAIGTNMAWVITDNMGIILDLPLAPPFDLEGSGAGVCLLWNVSFEDGLTGAEIGMNAENLIGCHDLSNPITITRLVGDNCDLIICDADGGTIALDDAGTTSITICVDDMVDDPLSPILMGSMGENTQWVVTDLDANILALPDALPINLEGAEPGTCLIWNLTYEDGLTGLEVDNNVSALSGCFDLSNFITVTRVAGEDCEGINCDVDGGAITLLDGETSITICVGDSIPDPLDVLLTNNTGMNSAWVITSINGTILGLPDAPPFDLDDAGTGVCLIWHLSYDDIEGLEIDSNSNDLSGCFDLSNPIAVTRVSGANCDNLGCEAQGGEIATTDGLTEIEICVGDGISDEFDVVLENNSGTNSQWVVTNPNAIIIDLPAGPPFDLEDAGPGICILWHLSYEDGLTGLELDNSILQLDGCYDLSNTITVTRFDGANCQMIGCEANGGLITFSDSTVVFEVCSGDEVDDIADVILDGNSGTNSQWVITNNVGEILDLPMSPPFNFEGAPSGICLIWHISYEDGIEGLVTGENINDLAGCFNKSNSLTVIRNEVFGGQLTFEDGTISTEICVGDGIPDSIQVILNGALGENMDWIITNTSGQIVGLPDTFPVDFEGVEDGICLIWNISYAGVLEGLELDSNAMNISGCFDLSNSIELIRESGPDCDGGLIDPSELEDIMFTFGPNPTSGMLNVDFQRLPSKKAEVKIMNSTGQLIQTAKSNDGESLLLDVNYMQDGMYFIMVESSTRIKVKKFLKIK